MIKKTRNGLTLDDKNLAHDLIWNKNMNITKAAKKFDVAISTMHRIKVSDFNKKEIKPIPKTNPADGLAISYKRLEQWAIESESINQKMTADNLANYERWADDRKLLEAELDTAKFLLQKVEECPYSIDKDTIPMTGNTINPQVMGSMNIANFRLIRIKSFLEKRK